MDPKSSYWHVDLQPDDKEKTVFSMHHELWRFTVIPFCLCNTQAIFEQLMETILRGLMSHVSYLGDMIMTGHTFQEQLLNMWKVFLWFQDASLKFNLEKFQLFQKEIWYLRHTVPPEGITINREKLKARYLRRSLLK
jgi:hypothetical protein